MKRLFFLFLGLGLFLNAALCPAARAADEDARRLIEAQTAQDGVSNMRWSAQITHPGVRVYVLQNYPQGLHPTLDGEIAIRAKLLFDNACEEFLDAAETAAETALAEAAEKDEWAEPADNEGKAASPYFGVTTYEITRPSERYATVIYKYREYSGGAHSNWTYDARSYDLYSGEELAFEDLFGDSARARPAVEERIGREIRAKKDKRGLEVVLDAETINLRMHRIALTAQGMRIIYAPYEMGSFAEGEFMVDIPSKDLIELGARPGLWK
ncbi:DUF3298 and DUF4163 domain-containing protein [Desulfovibrio sp. OttesenSCG-928-A18]|nr:DUF3298 and DUF4163 domain-containing protein [Desulfovibrio sp. OttesenSCG-928-A18]